MKMMLPENTSSWLSEAMATKTKMMKESQFSFARARRGLKRYVLKQSLFPNSASDAELEQVEKESEPIFRSMWCYPSWTESLCLALDIVCTRCYNLVKLGGLKAVGSLRVEAVSEKTGQCKFTNPGSNHPFFWNLSGTKSNNKGERCE